MITSSYLPRGAPANLAAPEQMEPEPSADTLPATFLESIVDQEQVGRQCHCVAERFQKKKKKKTRDSCARKVKRSRQLVLRKTPGTRGEGGESARRMQRDHFPSTQEAKATDSAARDSNNNSSYTQPAASRTRPFPLLWRRNAAESAQRR